MKKEYQFWFLRDQESPKQDKLKGKKKQRQEAQFKRCVLSYNDQATAPNHWNLAEKGTFYFLMVKKEKRNAYVFFFFVTQG